MSMKTYIGTFFHAKACFDLNKTHPLSISKNSFSTSLFSDSSKQSSIASRKLIKFLAYIHSHQNKYESVSKPRSTWLNFKARQPVQL